MEWFCLTGASKGLGRAFALSLIDRAKAGHSLRLVLLSRSEPVEVLETARTAAENGVDVQARFIEIDLLKARSLQIRMPEIFPEQDTRTEHLVLINNAGLLSEPAPLERMKPSDISRAYHVNLIAPAILSSIFLRRYADFKGRKTILSITSGAAQRAIPGASVYCSSKAGLDMLMKTGAEEAAGSNTRILAISPGMVETEMQQRLRGADKNNLPEVEFYKNAAKNGIVRPPEEAAKKILDWLVRSDPDGGIYHLDEI